MAHLAVMKAYNPAIFFPGAPVNGVCTMGSYVLRTTGTACSTTANTNARRRLTFERPEASIGPLGEFDDGAMQSYNGMVLSLQRRAAGGVTVNGNYTWSHCIGDNDTRAEGARLAPPQPTPIRTTGGLIVVAVTRTSGTFSISPRLPKPRCLAARHCAPWPRDGDWQESTDTHRVLTSPLRAARIAP